MINASLNHSLGFPWCEMLFSPPVETWDVFPAGVSRPRPCRVLGRGVDASEGGASHAKQKTRSHKMLKCILCSGISALGPTLDTFNINIKSRLFILKLPDVSLKATGFWFHVRPEKFWHLVCKAKGLSQRSPTEAVFLKLWDVATCDTNGRPSMWMDEILHHFEAMGNHCLLAPGESSLQALCKAEPCLGTGFGN